MALKVGFAETDITPPVGTHKIGWKKDIVSDRVLDPLFARTAVLECAGEKVAFVQLDTLSIRWSQVSDIRQRIAQMYAFPARSIMVAATHNHAGPAVANAGDVKRDDAYIQSLVTKVVFMFGQVLTNMQEAEIGFGNSFEFDVAYNRRVIMRDGTVRTHGKFTAPGALCIEGPIDPELAVMVARTKAGKLLGAIVNFTCHPTHHGSEGALSAGFPGVLAMQMKSRGCLVTLYLNGASGNITHIDPRRPALRKSKEEIGAILADDVSSILARMEYRTEVKLGSRSKTIQLPFRKITEKEIKGTAKGAQRFIDSAIYDREIPRQIERIRRMGTQPAEVQVIFVDEYAFVAIPAEYFVQHGLRIKEKSHPRHALIVGHANGMVGYVPHKEAFLRGGYETTFCGSSRLAPEAGDMLADCAIELLHQGV
ncbi:MAG: hypothetical protein AMS15_04730 [Planctomycetes bacterium DG_23]|nr:MAG: hypothetical protein AMS15_04730 [Planctomycetes bacterium DG_23]